MIDLVLLPATEADNDKYGRPPDKLPGAPALRVRLIRYPRLVWYNAAVRNEAMRQLEALASAPMILVGFSKSGLGAWNLTHELGERIAATIIFDAPMTRRELPDWGTAPFYDDKSWREDLPLETIDRYCQGVGPEHRLALFGGEGFDGDMCEMSAALHARGRDHHYQAGPERPHRWDSGWLEDGLRTLGYAQG